MVGKIATDGTHVFWADTGNSQVVQIGATGGATTVLAGFNATYGAPTGELALAKATVGYVYDASGTNGKPSVGLVTVGAPSTAVSAYAPGGVQMTALSLNPAATHAFVVTTFGTSGDISDCNLSGLAVGTCSSPGPGANRYGAITAADANYMVFVQTQASVQGMFVETVATGMANQISSATDAANLALDGTWVYYAEGTTTFTISRALEATGGNPQTVVGNATSPAFATDGINLYYQSGSNIDSKPVGGGAVQSLSSTATTQATQIAVWPAPTGGGLLVWTDSTTIYGIVLPP